MSTSPESLSCLLALIYEAAADPNRWPDFLNAVCAQADATRAYFLLQDSGTPHRDFSIQVGFSEKEQKDYVSYYAQHDLLFQRIVEAQRQAGGDWICERSALVPDDEYYKSVIFNEFLRPVGSKHVAAAALSGLQGMSGGLGIQRLGSRPFSEETLSLITILGPHMKRALGLHKRLSALRDENEDLRCTIEEIGCAVVSTDSYGQVLNCSSSARLILEKKDGLLFKNGRMLAARSSEQNSLEELISGAAATASGRGFDHPVEQSIVHSPQAGKSARWSAPSGGATLISRRPPKRPLQVVVFPFRSSTLLLETRPSALIFISDPDAIPASRGSVLQALYGLTRTECRLADCLVSGMELKLAAEHINLTRETARFHLKQIFRKCGIRSQSALMRLSLGLPGMA